MTFSFDLNCQVDNDCRNPTCYIQGHQFIYLLKWQNYNHKNGNSEGKKLSFGELA